MPGSADAFFSTEGPPMIWHAEDLWQHTAALLPGFTVEVLPSIDSTNTELMRRARAGHTDPVLLITEEQTAGKGRQGRPWSNAPGSSLMCSLGLVLAPQDWSGLSLAVGLAVAQALQPTAPHAPLRIGLKWPNDLWLTDDRKLGGILIETANLPHAHQGGQGGRYVIIGIGLNIQPPAQTGAWTTPPACLQELDPRWTAPLALAQLLPMLVRQLLAFAEGGFAPCVAQFAELDVLRGRAVHTSDGLAGLALGVGPDGALRIETAHGTQTIHSAEVSVRPHNMPLPR